MGMNFLGSYYVWLLPQPCPTAHTRLHSMRVFNSSYSTEPFNQYPIFSMYLLIHPWRLLQNCKFPLNMVPHITCSLLLCVFLFGDWGWRGVPWSPSSSRSNLEQWFSGPAAQLWLLWEYPWPLFAGNPLFPESHLPVLFYSFFVMEKGAKEIIFVNLYLYFLIS